MNDLLTQRMNMTQISGDVAPDLRTNLGPQGDQFRLYVPEGWAARLYDFSVYHQWLVDSRYGINLMKGPAPFEEGVAAWGGDTNVLRDSGSLAALLFKNDFVTSGSANAFYPHTEHLWDLDFRLVLNPRVTGFVQVASSVGFRLRYRLVKASRSDVANILFWQNEGVKRA